MGYIVGAAEGKGSSVSVYRNRRWEKYLKLSEHRDAMLDLEVVSLRITKMRGCY